MKKLIKKSQRNVVELYLDYGRRDCCNGIPIVY